MKIKSLMNSYWAGINYVVEVLFVFIITIIFTQNLSLQDYGLLIYGKSLLAIATSIATLGFKNFLIRSISKNLKDSSYLLGNSLIIISISTFLSYVFFTILILSIDSIDHFFFLALFLAGILFNPFSLFDFYFRAKFLTKYSFYSKLISGLISGLLKIFLVIYDYSMLTIALSFIFESLLFALSLLFFYKKNNVKKIFNFSRFNSNILNLVLPFFYINILELLNLKIGFFFAKYFMGIESAALYDIAGKLYDFWFRLEIVLFISFTPFLIKKREISIVKYKNYFQALLTLFFLISIIISITYSLIADKVILNLFGENYLESINCSIIIMWTSCVSTIWLGFGRYMIIENLEFKLLIRLIIIIFVNLIGCFILYKDLGINGIAIAGLFSYFVCAYLLNYLDMSSKDILRIQNNLVKFKELKLLVIWSLQIIKNIKK